MRTRQVALDVLMDVSVRGAYAQLALHERLKAAKLEGRDNAFVTNIVMGTIEHRLRLAYLLNTRLQKPVQDKTAWEILLMGVYQIVYMDKVPDSAAVNTSVTLADKFSRDLKGLVNAVLRRISEDQTLQFPPDMPENARLSVEHSMPEWIVAAMMEQYGSEKALRILSAQPPKFIAIRPNALRGSDAAFAEHCKRIDWEVVPGMVKGSFRLLNVPNPAATEEFFRGAFSIEGEAAQLAARVTGARPGMQVYDACAAPGGKSMLMAEMMQNTGRVYSMDIHEHRVQLMQGYARRLRLDNVRPGMRDARVFREDLAGVMDVVLIDAPCSGLGVFPSKQDIKYRLKPEDIASLAGQQKEILDACCGYVKPGGVLVYATCTLFKEENQERVAEFLATHPEFALDAFPPEWVEGLPEEIFLNDAEMLILPGEMEGFYIARMKRLR